MKKLLITLLLLMTVNFAYSQMKMNFNMSNPRDSVGFLMYDLNVTVLAGQVWHVGASNIRVTHTTTGTGSLTVQADNPAKNPNPNIHNANGYQAMTTTSVSTGAAIGLNILTFNTSGFHAFGPGTYRLGTLRWARTNPLSLITMTFRVPPTSLATVVYDSTVLLTFGTNYTVVNPNPISVSGLNTELPKEYNLSQNYPNPFNPRTTVKFDLPKFSSVTLKIYDIAGQEVEVLVNHNMEAGTYEYSWDATNYASGVYFYRLTTGEYQETKRMVLLK